MSAVVAETLARHSRIPVKRRSYSDDTYFREGLEDLIAALGPDVDRFCFDHTLLLLKPDAVVARQLGRARRWLAVNRFAIVGVTIVAFDRHVVRALWQYGLTAASRDRRDAADLYMSAGSCLLLLLSRPGSELSASAELTALKGPAEPARCQPRQLRHHLGSRNYQLNMVHCADEPADFIRELAVLCDSATRLRLVSEELSATDADARAVALARQLESETAPQSLDLADVVASLITSADSAAPLRVHLAAIQAGTSRDWRTALRLAEEDHVEVTAWQRIVLATHLLDPFLPGRRATIPDLADTPSGRETRTW